MIGSGLEGERSSTDVPGPASKLLLPIITDLTVHPDPNFKLPAELSNAFVTTALGPTACPTAREIWTSLLASTYAGDAGRVKLRQATTMVLAMDSLRIRAADLRMPILWIQGSEDVVFSPENARVELALTGSVEPRLEVVQGGPHSCHSTHPQVVNPLLREFAVKHGKKLGFSGLSQAYDRSKFDLCLEEGGTSSERV